MKTTVKLVMVLFLLLLYPIVGSLARALYILWRRRRCCRDSPTAGPEVAAAAGGRSWKWFIPHLRRWKNNSRVEPAASPVEMDVEEKREEEDGYEVIWRAMYRGPSRVLDTIHEEEWEGLEEVEVEVVVLDVEDDMEFSTPCASPEFHTPAHSPRSLDAVQREVLDP